MQGLLGVPMPEGVRGDGRMSEEIERKIAALGPEETAEEAVFRIAWPFHPAYFGIRVIQDPDELAEAIGGQTPEETLEPMRRLIREGMRVVIIEAAPSEIRTFVRIMRQASEPVHGGQS